MKTNRLLHTDPKQHISDDPCRLFFRSTSMVETSIARSMALSLFRIGKDFSHRKRSYLVGAYSLKQELSERVRL